jgi:hypothetical protein
MYDGYKATPRVSSNFVALNERIIRKRKKERGRKGIVERRIKKEPLRRLLC